MKIKVSAATPRQLNFMVAKCQGVTEFEFWHTGAVTTRWPNGITQTHSYADSWSQGGPILSDMRGLKLKIGRKPGAPCYAHIVAFNGREVWHQTGKTALIAVCRCYVSSKLGEEVEVPDELA